jgi:Pregnancy-associated plasma protein-A
MVWLDAWNVLLLVPWIYTSMAHSMEKTHTFDIPKTFSNDDQEHFDCGTHDVPDDVSQQIRSRLAKYKGQRDDSSLLSSENSNNSTTRRSLSSKLCTGCHKIDLVFHVIEDEKRKSDASRYLTDSNIALEVRTLNENFRKTPFQFIHRNTTRTINDKWAFGKVYEKTEVFGRGRITPLVSSIVAALRVGGPDVANVFFQDNGPPTTTTSSSCTANFASIPQELGMFPEDVYSNRDYIFICPQSIVAGPRGRVNKAALTHEMGHWLGLLHTFAGGSCDPSNPNDYVDDTPQQSNATGALCSQCCSSMGRDSCPKTPGMDDVANFMDYSPCPSHFTPGQIERMYYTFAEFRRRVEPTCGELNIDVHIEVQYDNKPLDLIAYYFSRDAQENNLASVLTPIAYEPQINFTYKKVSRDLCLSKQRLHEFYFYDRNGVTAPPGYYSIYVNQGPIVTTRLTVPIKESIFVFGDSATCPPSNPSRLRLQFSFDTTSSHGILWSILGRNKTNVMNDKTLLRHLPKEGFEYPKILSNNTLLVDKCLRAGVYDFKIKDKDPKLRETSSYVVLSVQNKEIYRTFPNGGGFKDVFRFRITNPRKR